MKILINYADSKYAQARKWNTWSGLNIAKFDKVYSFGPKDIDIEFKNKHIDIFKIERGNGLWLWKPYLINKVVDNVQNGDIIFYCDSGSFFIRNPQKIFNYLSETSPLFVCDIPLIESCWTKSICFEKLGLTGEEYRNSNQIIATYFVFLVNDFTRNFIKEWLLSCCDYELISPAGLGKRQNPQILFGKNFVSHREDQSIFSLLCKKYKIKAHRDFSQRGKDIFSYYSKWYAFKIPIHKDDTYKTILFLHKSPRVNIIMFIKYFKNKISRKFKK